MKKIGEIYKNATGPVFSFEFFPPKTDEGLKKLYETVEELKPLRPDFVSVTYGAGGSTRGKTFEITSEIINRFGIPAASHFTGVGSTRDEIVSLLQEMQEKGIRNIMALRGDPPQGQKDFDVTKSAFAHASDMIRFIRENGFDFSLGGACYPEVHPEASSLDEDVGNLKKKVDAGAEYLLSQLFFKNDIFYRFMEAVKSRGIAAPVVPGIMPITSFGQIARFRELAGCEIPEDFVAALEKVKDDEERFLETSMEFTVRQCQELLKWGVPGIHLYTLNKSRASIDILKKLKS